MLGAYVTAVGFATVGAVFLARTAVAGSGGLWEVAVPALAGAAVTIGAGLFGPACLDPTARRESAAPVPRREPATRDDTRRERRSSESAPPATPRRA